MKIHHGIIGRQHLVDLRRMALLHEQYEEKEKEHQLLCYSQDWIRDGGLILCNAVTICETFKTSKRTEKHFLKNDSENHFKVP